MTRVGTNTFFRMVGDQLTKAQYRIFKTRQRISSGKQVNSISDKPEKIQSLLYQKNALSKNKRYSENINTGLEYLTVVQSKIDHLNTIITDVKRLSVEGSDTIGDIEWDSYSQKIDQYLEEFVNIGNSKFKDRFVFSGTSTKTTPYTLATDGSNVTVNASGIDQSYRIEIGKFQNETININGSDLFDDNVNIYDTLIQLRDAFSNHDSATIQNLMNNIDASQSQILAQGAKVGGMITRFELINSQYEQENINIKSFISNIEDADLLEESMNLQKEEMALQAALTVTSRGMNLSLVNYLK